MPFNSKMKNKSALYCLSAYMNRGSYLAFYNCDFIYIPDTLVEHLTAPKVFSGVHVFFSLFCFLLYTKDINCQKSN